MLLVLDWVDDSLLSPIDRVWDLHALEWSLLDDGVVVFLVTKSLLELFVGHISKLVGLEVV